MKSLIFLIFMLPAYLFAGEPPFEELDLEEPACIQVEGPECPGCPCQQIAASVHRGAVNAVAERDLGMVFVRLHQSLCAKNSSREDIGLSGLAGLFFAGLATLALPCLPSGGGLPCFCCPIQSGFCCCDAGYFSIGVRNYFRYRAISQLLCDFLRNDLGISQERLDEITRVMGNIKGKQRVRHYYLERNLKILARDYNFDPKESIAYLRAKRREFRESDRCCNLAR